MTRIWLVNWHFQSTITLWCRHKSTNVSMGLCWQMPKFIIWRLWSIYFDHHLPLKPFIGKRRKQSCTSNTLLRFWKVWPGFKRASWVYVTLFLHIVFCYSSHKRYFRFWSYWLCVRVGAIHTKKKFVLCLRVSDFFFLVQKVFCCLKLH